MFPKQSGTKFSLIILVLILVIVLPGVPKCDYEKDKENEKEYGRLQGSCYFTDKAQVCDSCVATSVTR
jgi:hypothetical protein